MQTLRTYQQYAKNIVLAAIVLGASIAPGTQIARASSACAVDQRHTIEASAAGSKTLSAIVSDACAKVSKKHGSATFSIGTTQRGYGAYAFNQRASRFGCVVGCSSQFEADYYALAIAGGGVIADRWVDR